MRSISILSILLFFIPLNPLKAQDSLAEKKLNKISLKINLKPETSYRFTSKQAQYIIQDMMGNSMEIKQEIDATFTLEIENNNGEEYKMKATFEEMELNLHLPQDQIINDSKRNSLSEFSPILNKPFYIHLTEQGEVIKLEGLEEDLIQNLTAFIEQSFHIFPTDSINMGESWQITHSHKLNDQFDLIIDKTFTLEGLSEDMVWIAVENRIKNSSSEFLSFESESIVGKQEGLIEVDRNSGLILFSDIKHEFQGLLRSNDLEIPVKISLESSLKGELIGN